VSIFVTCNLRAKFGLIYKLSVTSWERQCLPCNSDIVTWCQSLSSKTHLAMASSSSALVIPASLSILVSEKLTRENYLLWRAQVLPAIRAAQFEGFLDGSEIEPPKKLTVEKDSKKMEVANPDYVTWHVRDQYVLTYLVTSLSREVLAGIPSCSTAAGLWTAITRSFASQSRSRILHLRTQIGNTRKGDMSMTMYFSKMRRFAEAA
jgi:hypothetical protein